MLIHEGIFTDGKQRIFHLQRTVVRGRPGTRSVKHAADLQEQRHRGFFHVCS